MTRVMGIETEYGILDPADSWANPMEMSAAIVMAYCGRNPHAAWDYIGEDPLNDARGYRLPRAAADISQLTDSPQLRAGAPGAVIGNGGRFYVDHAHPEYSSPEVSNARDALLWDRAGDVVARAAMDGLASEGRTIVLYKNNVDGKGASYGTHENYLVDRAVPFHEIGYRLTPFFVTRPLMVGSGRVGLGQKSQEPGFQISQRADYVENDIGLETTFNRPIINTRDEPHATPEKYRRLHVIGGDANLFDVPSYLKFATTSLVLTLIERDVFPLAMDTITLTAPVVDSWGVSHDPFDHVLSTQTGRKTALDVQRMYLDLAAEHLAGEDDETDFALALWDEVLTGLASDPDSVADAVEWVAKKQILEGMRSRFGTGWQDPRLAALDLQWSDLRLETGLVPRLEAAGKVRRLVSDGDVARAAVEPPADTRAYVRGTAVQRFGLRAASWTSLVAEVPELTRIPLGDPLTGTKAETATLGSLRELFSKE
ncbi:proteasome accessory factor A [Ruaniaceae bacterium KH17]|nr:proteasome accessory factor A [Ruaniaceae bacterium KH17]